jgi:hypothetical protein
MKKENGKTQNLQALEQIRYTVCIVHSSKDTTELPTKDGREENKT